MFKKLKKLYNLKLLYKTDAFLISFPKSGNTWIRFLLANILNDKFEHKSEVDFSNIENYVPTWPYNLNGLVEKKPIIVKVHQPPLNHLVLKNCFRNNFIYIIRNPIDVMISYYLYSTQVDNYSSSSFSEFLSGDRGIKKWVKHVETYSAVSNFIIIYEKLLEKDTGEIDKLIKFLPPLFKWEVSYDQILRALSSSSREKMRTFEKKAKQNGQRELIKGTPVREYYDFVATGNRNIPIKKKDIEYIKNECRKLNSRLKLSSFLSLYGLGRNPNPPD
jgi:hypothetical protein